MTVHRDIETVRRFLARELEQRQAACDASRYLKSAHAALNAFERLAAYVGEQDRRKQLADFDEVFGQDPRP